MCWECVSFGCGRLVGHCAYIVEIHQYWGLGAFVFEQLLGQLVKTIHLVLSLLHNPLKGAKVRRRGALVEEIDVDMLGNGVFALGDGLEEGTLAAAVLAQEPVPAAQRQLERGVGDQDAAVEHQTGAGDLDVLAGGGRGQDTGGDPIRQTMLVHLLGEALDLVGLVGRGSGLIGHDGVSKGIELGLIAVDRSCSAGDLGAGLGSRGNCLLFRALGEALLLGCRRAGHDRG
jgi:hypothetical protein